MVRSVATKMGIKQGVRAILINAPEDIIQSIDPPDIDLLSSLRGSFDYIHFFAKTQQELDNKFSALRDHLKPTGMLWISWPKGGKEGSDLNIKLVIKIGYNHGLVESKALSINETWSALKFTHPKSGKVYNNSYGVLKDKVVSNQSS